MSKQNSTQRGDTMTVTITVIVLVIIGALGFVAWKNFIKNDTVTQGQESSVDTRAEPEVTTEWIGGTDKATGVSYATPAAWLTKDCDNICTVTVTKHDVDTDISLMKGPNYPVRYVSAQSEWQTIEPSDNTVIENRVISLKEKAAGEFSAALYTGGDGPMSQSHILVVNGDSIYQFALPISVYNVDIQDEKMAKAGEFVKTIKF